LFWERGGKKKGGGVVEDELYWGMAYGYVSYVRGVGGVYDALLHTYFLTIGIAS
jgi:hypothetical protein